MLVNISPIPAVCLCQQTFQNQINSCFFLFYGTSSNSDKLKDISFLEMYTSYSKITRVALNVCFFSKGNICKISDWFLMYVCWLGIISTQNYDVTMHVSFARVHTFITCFIIPILNARQEHFNMLNTLSSNSIYSICNLYWVDVHNGSVQYRMEFVKVM